METAFDSKKLLAMTLLCCEINTTNYTGMPNLLLKSYQAAAECVALFELHLHHI